MDRKNQIEFKLYLGRNMTLPNGTVQEISETHLADFTQYIIAPRLESCTLENALGLWRRTPEPTIILTFIGSDDDRDTVRVMENSIHSNSCRSPYS